MLIVLYFVQSPTIVLVGGFVLGFAAAGGVLQLATATANAMFPTNKGKITSIVMISSSAANYIILNIANLPTNNVAQLREALDSQNVGSVVNVEINRQGKNKIVAVTLEEMPAE